jgi:hypothetical protein
LSSDYLPGSSGPAVFSLFGATARELALGVLIDLDHPDADEVQEKLRAPVHTVDAPTV